VTEWVAADLQTAARVICTAHGIAEVPFVADGKFRIQERHAAALLRGSPEVALVSLADSLKKTFHGPGR
jgi:hypothetical protein